MDVTHLFDNPIDYWRVLNMLLAAACLAEIYPLRRQWLALPNHWPVVFLGLGGLLVVALISSAEQLAQSGQPGVRLAALTLGLSWSLYGLEKERRRPRLIHTHSPGGTP